MLSQTTEYAMRAVVFLADMAPAPKTSEQISAVTKVPNHYLSKVLQHLSRAQLLRSQRGLGGGFTLAKDPEELTLLDVVNAVEPIPRILSCPLEITSHGVNLCPLHRHLDDAMAAVESALSDSTIAQILENRAGSVPLCPFPKTPRDQPAGSRRER